MPEYNEVLVSLRKKLELSQQELANRLGMTRSAISMYETGQREPDLETLEIFADFFNVDMNTLTGHSALGEDPRKQKIDRLEHEIKLHQARLEAYLKSSYDLIDNVRDFLELPLEKHKIVSHKDDDFLDCLADSQAEMENVLNQVNSYFEKYVKDASKEKRELFLKRYKDIARQFKKACSELDIVKISSEDNTEDT